MGTYALKDIFSKISARYKGEGDKFKEVSNCMTSDYNIPVVYAKAGDNGIMYWAKEGDFETQENVLSIVYNGAIAAGLVYAQPRPTGILAESYFIKVTNQEVPFETNLYLKTAIEKAIYPKYSRENLATWTGKVENDIILLPKKNNQPDYTFMSDLICAVEKLVIKDLVEWTDKRIEATKEIVAR